MLRGTGTEQLERSVVPGSGLFVTLFLDYHNPLVYHQESE